MPALKSFITRTAVAADRLMPPPAGVTVLIYHRVGGGSDSQVDLPLDQFEQQLEHLVAHHRVISLDDAVVELTERTTVNREHASRRPVVITFDDGTADFTDCAVPALNRHRLPAALYVATQFVENREPFPWGAPPTSWSALGDAVADGDITIGSHTHAHWLMDRLDRRLVDDDLDRSISLIRERLGVDPAHFAYPKAVPGSPHADIAIRRRFRTAALATSRVNRFGHTDLHQLWRTPIQRSDDLAMFARKADGGLRLEGEARAVVARARYRGAAR